MQKNPPAPGKMIFISYRIADSNEFAARLDDSLADSFGRMTVFRDKSRLQAGEVWADAIEEEVARTRVMLVVIGRTWHSASFSEGRYMGYPRLHDPEDVVRREITGGLRGQAHVVPVLVDGAEPPSREWLANFGLDPLADIQAFEILTDRYAEDLEALTRRIEELCPDLQSRTAPRRRRTSDEDAWNPRVVHALQPAPHFSGRDEIASNLLSWARDPASSVRVRALVAAGGTGKTAIAEKVVTQLGETSSFGIFAWSFYEDQRTEAFLREAMGYFATSETPPSESVFENLQAALSTPEPHLLVLDGLELVQAFRPRVRGAIEDPLLRRLLRWLAAGIGTNTRALITSRFDLIDLADCRGDRVSQILLEDLTVEAAAAVLRGWGVEGSQAQLVEALSPLRDPATNRVHALTASVLGSYVGRLWGGDVSKAPTLERDFIAGGLASDPKGGKLTRVLESYAEKLSPPERDLLSRLSQFPRGVSTTLLCGLSQAASDVAGSLAGASVSQIREHLEGLRSLGLVFRSLLGGEENYTAHPFLREFFATLHKLEDPTRIPAEVRTQLARSIQQRPGAKPSNAAELDQLERLIEMTALAGEKSRAFSVYKSGLGGYEHLGWNLGQFVRGLRIVSMLGGPGGPTSTPPDLQHADRIALLEDWGTYAEELGDLATAKEAFKERSRLCGGRPDRGKLAAAQLGEADVFVLSGEWQLVEARAEVALQNVDPSVDLDATETGYARLGEAQFWQGKLKESSAAFAAAERIAQRSLYSRRGVAYATTLALSGAAAKARMLTRGNLEMCRSRLWKDDVAICETLLGRCFVATSPESARTHLTAAREYSSRTGHVEVTLRSYQLAAEIARAVDDFEEAARETEAGIELAESCGYMHWSVWLRIELARALLHARDYSGALASAIRAKGLADDPSRNDHWAQAAALQVMGIAHKGLRQPRESKRTLKKALALQKALRDPLAAETRGFTSLRSLPRFLPT